VFFLENRGDAEAVLSVVWCPFIECFCCCCVRGMRLVEEAWGDLWIERRIGRGEHREG